MKVHKCMSLSNFATVCGYPELNCLKRSDSWEEVTCGNCLKSLSTPVKEKNLCWCGSGLKEKECVEESPYTQLEKKEILVDDKKYCEKGTTCDEGWCYKKDKKQVLDEIVDDNDALSVEPKKEKEKTPYQKWEDWHKLCCDWNIDPQYNDIWNGAIDTVCAYLVNEMCLDLDLYRTYEIINKAKKKIKLEE